MKFSLMFFSSGDGGSAGRSYGTILNMARFADQHAFERVWLPERHFVEFGALHPNPSVLAAAVARETHRIRIAAGSVVAPLHDPIRIAEEWSVVDNLSGGRVDLAFASGWRAEDFALAPDRYTNRKTIVAERVAEVQALWRGECVTRRSGSGAPTRVTTFPRPVQRDLPTWITAARSIETFELAGSLGANVLTYLVDVGLNGLAERIAAYRGARERAGLRAPDGCVTVMLHTYLGEDSAVVRAFAEPAYTRYLVENRSLFAPQPTENRPGVSLEQAEQLAAAQFERLFEGLSLVGEVRRCRPTVEALQDIGADEIACLVDFVDDFDAAVAALPFIVTLRSTVSAASVVTSPPDIAPRDLQVDALASTASVRADGAEFYRYVESIGGQYGPSFRLIQGVVADETQAIARLRAPDPSLRSHTRALITDAALATAHAIGMSPGLRASTRPLGLPIGMSRILVHDLTSDEYRVTTTRGDGGWSWMEFDVDVRNADGRPALSLERVRFQRVASPLMDATSGTHPLIHDVLWRSIADLAPGRPIGNSLPPVLISTIDAAADSALTDALRRAGHVVYRDGREKGAVAPESIPVLLAHAVAPWTRSDVDSPRSAVASIAAWVRRWAGSQGTSPVVLVRGANRVLVDDPPPDPNAAAAWAAACSMAGAPNRPLTIVDLDPRIPLGQMMVGVIEAAAHHRGTAYAVRGNAVYEPHFESRPQPDRRGGAIDDPPIVPASSILVTGGTGALGRWLAGWLCAEGAGRIRLVSRRTTRASGWAARLSASTTVELVEADLADPLQASRAAGEFDTIFHLAGDVGEALGAAPDAGIIDRCFRPKLDGLLNLCRSMPSGTRRLVLFSSVSALTGSAGQAAYAAANAAMVAAAQQIVEPHVDLRVVWFGPWDNGGMADGDEVRARLREKGVSPMAPWKALAALRVALSSQHPTAVVVERVDADREAEQTAVRRPESTNVHVEPERAEVLATLRRASPEHRAALLELEILREVGAIMEVEPSQIDPTRSVYDIGFDSLMALELKNAVLRDYGVTISLADVMQFNTVRDVAQALAPVLLDSPSPSVLERSSADRSPARPLQPVVEPDAAKELIL